MYHVMVNSGDWEYPIKEGPKLRSAPWRPGMKTAILAVAVVSGIVIVNHELGRQPPPVFRGATSLSAAAANANGRPVLAFATADWCGPCKHYKRTSLRDDRVTAIISERASAAYINIDLNKDDAAALGVTGVPALYVLENGVVVAELGGAAEAEKLLAWLEQELPAPKPEATPGG